MSNDLKTENSSDSVIEVTDDVKSTPDNSQDVKEVVEEESTFSKKLKQSSEESSEEDSGEIVETDDKNSSELESESDTQETQDDSEEINVEEEMSNEGNWYIIQAYTGKEHDVELRINQLVEHKKWEDKIYRVLVPEEEMIEIKNNKRVEKKAKIFSGYVFIQMDDDHEVFYEIRRLPNVAKFVGSKVEPTPVTEDEILKVLRKSGDKTKKIDIDFEIDEVIKVVSGPFRGYSGTITDLYAERGKLKSLIPIFGRETPVELDFDQVEKTVK